ncbi:MAG: 4-(cytidine 5'-diphospho)-2-C-methyl-D-erythritol kinase [Clostridia bacterium]|nr:4-(cytidine 5'-diphospho)-2-C-methyl-D-erythritol kinase [Clostridia bacterium]
MSIIIENAAAVCYNLSMNYVRVKSYAKINLTLDITGVNGGYHTIDSVVASVDLYDLIAVKRRRDKLVSVTMHGEGSESIPYENNNAAKAAELFIARFGTDGADITVWKNVPMGAGLGGSSADVAGVLNAMAKLYDINDARTLKQLADGLGSDSGYMLTGGFARLTGRGDKVERLKSGVKLDIGLLIPKSGVSTAQCYSLSDSTGATANFTSNEAQKAVLAGNKQDIGASLSNGLYAAAIKLNSDVEECFDELKAFDPLGVNMTGSGSGVFAVFENDQFAQYAKSRYRGKHTFITTKTVVPTKEE